MEDSLEAQFFDHEFRLPELRGSAQVIADLGAFSGLWGDCPLRVCVSGLELAIFMPDQVLLCKALINLNIILF